MFTLKINNKKQFLKRTSTSPYLITKTKLAGSFSEKIVSLILKCIILLNYITSNIFY